MDNPSQKTARYKTPQEALDALVTAGWHLGRHNAEKRDGEDSLFELSLGMAQDYTVENGALYLMTHACLLLMTYACYDPDGFVPFVHRLKEHNNAYAGARR